MDTSPKPEEKLFFEGKYEECLNFIRHSLPKIASYDTNKKENLTILGAQCLFEIGKGNEIKSFFETCYNKQLIYLPPTVFFVWINYLFHINEYDEAINLLLKLPTKGKPMSKNEQKDYIKLVVYDGYVNHRQYNKAIKFLNQQNGLKDVKFKNILLDDVKLKMKNDPFGCVDNDDNDDDNNNNNDDDKDKKELSDDDIINKDKITDISSNENKLNKMDDTRFNKIKNNIYHMTAFIKEKTTRTNVMKMLLFLFVCWILRRILQKNKQIINAYYSDFRKLLIMSIGKSRISMN